MPSLSCMHETVAVLSDGIGGRPVSTASLPPDAALCRPICALMSGKPRHIATDAPTRPSRVLLQRRPDRHRRPTGCQPGCTSSSGLGRRKSFRLVRSGPHEALDFTPWLLQNVDVLSDLLGTDLVLEVAEHPVGDFSLDLKGYDETTGEVLIEQQLRLREALAEVGGVTALRDVASHPYCNESV